MRPLPLDWERPIGNIPTSPTDFRQVDTNIHFEGYWPLDMQIPRGIIIPRTPHSLQKPSVALQLRIHSSMRCSCHMSSSGHHSIFCLCMTDDHIPWPNSGQLKPQRMGQPDMHWQHHMILLHDGQADEEHKAAIVCETRKTILNKELYYMYVCLRRIESSKQGTVNRIPQPSPASPFFLTSPKRHEFPSPSSTAQTSLHPTPPP